MSKVAIVTDSIAYLPQKYLEQYDIKVAPLSVISGDESFIDRVEMSPSEFYSRLQKSAVSPTTSQVTVGAFQAMFAQLHQASHKILVIMISGKLSGTVGSAG
jgi:DegV family protein with EDD domain